MIFQRISGKSQCSIKGRFIPAALITVFFLSGLFFPAFAEDNDDDQEITFDPEDVEGMVLEPVTGVDENLEDMDKKVSGIKSLVEASRPSVIRISSTPVPKEKVRDKKKAKADIKLIEIKSTADSLGIGTIDNEKKDREITSKLGVDADANKNNNISAPDRILAAINSKLGGISACYSGELKVNPALSGRLYVQFTIQENGTVSGVETVESSLNSTRMEQCILNGIRTWRFDSPDQGQVTVRHPFIFERAF